VLTDFHCHLDLLTDLEDKLERAKKAGIGRFVTSALSEESVEKSFRLAEKFPEILVTIGLDANNPKEVGNFEARLDLIRQNKGKIAGIGEIGLDFLKADDSEKEKQRIVFQAGISLAEELGLPLTIHSRSAGKYALAELEKSGFPGKILMHAFDGRPFYASEAIKKNKNLFFSIPPSIVRSPQKQELVKALPIERLLLESDAPSLGPIPIEENEPANISLTIGKISEIRGISQGDLVKAIEENERNFLNQ